MSDSTKHDSPRPARRTIVKGAAWAVPAVAVASAAPAMAVSPCEPTFTAGPGSFKCCDGPLKTMKVVIQVTDTSGCLNSTSTICITDVYPSNGGTVGSIIYEPSACTTENGTITAYLYDVSNCGANLTVEYSVDDGPTQYGEVKSDTIPSGNTEGDCLAPPEDPEANDQAEEPVAKTTAEESTVEEPAVEEPAVEEPTTQTESTEPAPNADTGETTASP